MNTIKSLEWRYAVKKFDIEKNLSEAQITLLEDAFNLTASSYGLQPLKLVVVQHKNVQNELVQYSFNQPQIAQASHVLVICIPATYSLAEVDAYFELIQKIRNTPHEILNPFQDFLKGEIAEKSQQELKVWNTNQAYLALGNLLTVCALEKIDACPMEGFLPEKYDELLNLEAQNLTSVLVLPVGFRAADDYMKDLPKVRKGTANCVIKFSE